MNFLAHLWLAGEDEALRLGGLMGDFVKGPLPAGLPAAVAAGVALHRRIDSFANDHPAFQRSRERISPQRRRYAGIMVDMFYDHFLARDWATYHPEPLEDFCDEAYQMLARRGGLLPPALAEIAPYMAAADWLGSYARPGAIAQALDRMAVRRLRLPNTLAGAGAELLDHYEAFADDSRRFLIDAKVMVGETLAASAPSLHAIAQVE